MDEDTIIQNEWQDKELECFKDPMNCNYKKNTSIYKEAFPNRKVFYFRCYWVLLCLVHDV